MPEVATVRVRRDWIDNMIAKHGSLEKFGTAVGVEQSTVSRHLNGKSEAGPRFIGAVLTAFGVNFDEAFDVTIETATRRRARIVTQPAVDRVA